MIIIKTMEETQKNTKINNFEQVDISNSLPRGAQTKLAAQFKVSISVVNKNVSGKSNTRPDIYIAALDIAANEIISKRELYEANKQVVQKAKNIGLMG